MKDAKRKKEREGGNEDFRNKRMKEDEFLTEDIEVWDSSDSFPSLGVFEFPWDKDEKIVPELDDWTFDHVFNSSLVNDQFELDGEGLCPIPSDSIAFQDDIIEELWPLKKEEIDGDDSIWGCVLSQPLSISTSKVSSSSLKLLA